MEECFMEYTKFQNPKSPCGCCSNPKRVKNQASYILNVMSTTKSCFHPFRNLRCLLKNKNCCRILLT